jgi:hypothetical protein
MKTMKRELIDIAVETEPEFSVISGRNGTFRITKLRVWESNDHTHVYLDGIGKRGVSIRGGLCVSKECFTDLCRKFLAALATPAGAVQGTQKIYPKTNSDDCQIDGEGFCQTHQKVHLRETAAAMDIPAAESVTKEWNMRCPQCCSDEHIEIQASAWVKLTPEGTDCFDVQDGSHEWSSETPAQCVGCDYAGTVGDFEIDEVKSSQGAEPHEV